MRDAVAQVLARFPAWIAAGTPRPIGNAGGFSGSQFWVWTNRAGAWGLRRWPHSHPNVETLQFIHELLMAAKHCSFVPIPQFTINNQTIVPFDGYLWEVTPWMPGCADFGKNPSISRLQSAMCALAELHVAIRSIRVELLEPSPSPSLKQRESELHRLVQGELDRIQSAVIEHPRNRCSWYERIGDVALEILHNVRLTVEMVHSEVLGGLELDVRLQPVVRDIWRDHILFLGDRVTGIVDFGAARLDTVISDVTRLLGSLAGDNEAGRTAGLEAYETINQLTAEEKNLMNAFDRSLVLLSPLSWLRWIFLEKRQFETPEKVVERVTDCANRLQSLATRTLKGTTYPVEKASTTSGSNWTPGTRLVYS